MSGPFLQFGKSRSLTIENPDLSNAIVMESGVSQNPALFSPLSGSS
jgi:hypothetical protein